MIPTTELEAKEYVEKLSEYENQGYRVTDLRSAKELMLVHIKKAALAIDIMKFADLIWEKPEGIKSLTRLSTFFYDGAISVEDWANSQIAAIEQTIATDLEYINSIKVKKKLTKSEKDAVRFWEAKVNSSHQEIDKIKSAMAKIKTIAKNEQPKTLNRTEAITAILKMVEQHNTTVDAILKDYLIADGAELEIGAAGNGLFNEVESLQFEDEPQEENFDSLYKKMKVLSVDGCESEQVIELMGLFSEENKLDFIEDFATNNGYALIKVDTMDKRDRLKEFIETEIWPSYNEQQENVIM